MFFFCLFVFTIFTRKDLCNLRFERKEKGKKDSYGKSGIKIHVSRKHKTHVICFRKNVVQYCTVLSAGSLPTVWLVVMTQ